MIICEQKHRDKASLERDFVLGLIFMVGGPILSGLDGLRKRAGMEQKARKARLRG
jgi:hypothetical protein